MHTDIVCRPGGCGAACADILSELPEWFGIPESNASYAQDAETQPTWLALDANGRALGLMILKRHGDYAVENWLLAVRRAAHRQGVGAALIAAGEAQARAWGARFFTVKTLGPSAESTEYERTRAFYFAQGFVPLEEFDTLWSPGNPALFMAKSL